MHHVKVISKPRAAFTIAGATLDPVLLKEFGVAVLTAVNALMGRKHPATT